MRNERVFGVGREGACIIAAGLKSAGVPIRRGDSGEVCYSAGLKGTREDR